MSHLLLPILADGTDEMIKIIFGAVFVLIWIIGGLMSAAKKKPKPRTPEKSWDEIFRELSGEPQRSQPPPPPPAARRDFPSTPQQQVRRPAPRQPMPATVSGPPSRPAVRKKLRRKNRGEAPIQIAPPPSAADFAREPIVDVAAGALPALPGDIATSEIGTKAVRRAAGSAGADQLNKALRPENLRHQFILTEILQPPKALRDE